MTELQRELMLDDIKAQLNYLKQISPVTDTIIDKIEKLTEQVEELQ